MLKTLETTAEKTIQPGSIIIPGLWYPLRSSSRFLIERAGFRILNCRVMRGANIPVRTFCYSEEVPADPTAAITMNERLYARLLGGS